MIFCNRIISVSPEGTILQSCVEPSLQTFSGRANAQTQDKDKRTRIQGSGPMGRRPYTLQISNVIAATLYNLARSSFLIKLKTKVVFEFV